MAPRVAIDSLARGVVLSQAGDAVFNASVRIYKADMAQTPANQVVVYRAKTGSATYTQPLKTDHLGEVPGWVDPQQIVDISVNGSAVVQCQVASGVLGLGDLTDGSYWEGLILGGGTNVDLRAGMLGIRYPVPPGQTVSNLNTANAVVVDSAGRAILAGELEVNGQWYIAITRLLPVSGDNQEDLLVDPSFGTAGWTLVQTPGASGMAQQGLALQTDGKILVSGTANPGGVQSGVVLRLTTAGVLDTTFNTTGYHVYMPPSGTDCIAFGVAQAPDGTIIAVGGVTVGGATQICATRFTAAGAIDSTYGSSGTRLVNPPSTSGGAAWNLKFDSAGRAILGAQAKRSFSTTASGTNLAGAGVLNVTSVGGAAPAGIVNGVTITIGTGPTQETNIVAGIAGTALTLAAPLAHAHSSSDPVIANYDVMVVARFTTGGALDTTFNATGYNVAIWGLASIGFTLDLQSDGKIIVTGGGFVTLPQPIVARFNTDGTIDTTFGPNGNGAAYPAVVASSNAAVVQPDDKIIIANVDAGSGGSLVTRFLANGQLDLGFGINGNIPFPQGPYMTPNGVAVKSDGSIILGGTGTPPNGSQGFAISRLNSTGTAASDGVHATFRDKAAALPALPANGAVAQPVGAATTRSVWGAVTGDGAQVQFTIPHNLGSIVRTRGFDAVGGAPAGERVLAAATNPVDPTASVLVNFATPLPAGVSVFVLMEA